MMLVILHPEPKKGKRAPLGFLDKACKIQPFEESKGYGKLIHKGFVGEV